MTDTKTDIAVSETLYEDIRHIIEQARKKVYKTVNFTMVGAYWNIGRLIVENEQKGKRRAEYGTALIKKLSELLSTEFGKGYDESNLKRMRQFYLIFPPIQHSSPEKRKSAAPRHQLLPPTLREELSWTHYKSLIRVENPKARQWYLNEAADCNWGTRALDRQINTLYYERLIASRDKESVKAEAEQNIKHLSPKPEDFIKDPYVLEFLNLNPDLKYLEKDLEKALLDKLQQFLLELGKGFCFFARQYRISTETSEFYIDLVFYNYLLKCFVLIDLKTGQLSHQDIGQMDMYVRIFEDRVKPGGDNPTIGIILCMEKDETVVQYSVLNDSKQLFASKYKLYLPSEEELIEEIEREKAIILSFKQRDEKRERPGEKGKKKAPGK